MTRRFLSTSRTGDWEGATQRLLMSLNLGEHISADEAIHLLDDVMYVVEDIKTCAAAALQWPGDSEKDQAIRAAGVLVCVEFGVELRESEMEPS